ncbi:MAG: ABC transporter substrate-binding protein [Chloroflexota bacterium]
MKINKLYSVLSLLVLLSLVLAACAPATATATEAPAAMTEEPVATAAPTEVATEVPHTDRHGGWLDEIDYSVVASDSAISQVQAGAIDAYTYGIPSNQLDAIKSSGLGYQSYFGTAYSILMNPAPLKDTTKLNPFSDRKIREALNWLIDRNYVNQEIYGGGSLPKLFALATQLVDYTGVVDTARILEAKYAYNLDKAKQVISEEMTSMGATLGADGKWEFSGRPVTLIFLIRSDGDGTRKPMGDYVSNQLEAVGFTVDRQYKKSTEAAPIWQASDPTEGQWHMYTAGWGAAGLTRDEKNQFEQMYAPNSQQGVQPWLSNTAIDPELQKISDDLAQANFTTLEQRHDLMAKALELSLQDSLQVWVIDTKLYVVNKPNVLLTNDVGAGVESSPMNPFNMRYTDKEGGQLKIGTNDLFTQAWNTVGGSNYIWDVALMKNTAMGSDFAAAGGTVGDPFTGLAWNQRLASAEVTVQSGLPVTKSSDWVTLKTADTITVPADTWIDWDAKAQKFITVGEKYPNGLTAKVKSVVVYPSDLFTTVKWHDGSPISVADFIIPTIMLYDRAKPDSAIYDESAVPYTKLVQGYYKGFRITSTNPLTIENYSDLYYNDAELDVTTNWPNSAYGLAGENGWDLFAISNLAEAGGELAYSLDKSDANQVEETNWIGGPSLEILSKYLDQASSETYIPYAPTLEKYITADEANLRYANLKKWYSAHGHYWLGTGPYYLDKVFTTEKTAVLKGNPDFPDLSDRYAGFSTPKYADVQLDGPGQVKIGGEGTFDVTVTFNEQPYPQADVKQVKYLLYDATGALIASGEAQAVEDGHYQVTLTADITSKLQAGSNRLEVVVVPIPIAIPTFTSSDFVVVP